MKKIIVLVICCSFFILGSSSAKLPKVVDEYVPGEVIVKFKDPSRMNFTSVGVREVKGFQVFNNIKHLILSRGETVEEAIKILKTDDNVEYAEPNYIYRLADMREPLMPNDSFFNKLYGLHNVADNNNYKPDSDIDAPEAWSIFTGSKEIVVAVIDTGVDYNHKDLKGNIWVNELERDGEPGVDDDNNGYVDDIHGYDFPNKDGDPMDDHSHGTHCAGTIGAVGNNNLGVVGVNWNVSIMPIKFFSKSGSADSADGIRSIEYAIINKAHITSNSWGGGPFSQALHDIILEAENNGILNIFAAGNNSSNNDDRNFYPANYDLKGIVSVASTDARDMLSSFSNYGKTQVDLAAPGSNIYSTIPNNKYASKSGTSMATPHVAGAAALLMGYDRDLDLYDVKDRLMKTSDKKRSLKNKVLTHGRLNVYNLLKNIEPDTPWTVIHPSRWVRFDKEISTPHPYGKGENLTWEINHPGAKYIRVHFKKFETEKKYDFVYIKDAAGEEYEALHGKFDELYTEAVTGDTVILNFKADNIIHKYGFDIDYYEVVLD